MSSDSKVPDSAPLDRNLEPESTTCLVETIGKKRISFGPHLRADGILSSGMEMVVAFHTNTLGVRGSETAVWDYANFNETILGNRSVFCLREGLCEKANAVFAKWKARFPIVSYRSKKELSEKLQSQGASVLYQIKPGPFDGFLGPGVRNCIHSMFLSDEFHGDRFA